MLLQPFGFSCKLVLSLKLLCLFSRTACVSLVGSELTALRQCPAETEVEGRSRDGDQGPEQDPGGQHSGGLCQGHVREAVQVDRRQNQQESRQEQTTRRVFHWNPRHRWIRNLPGEYRHVRRSVGSLQNLLK